MYLEFTLTIEIPGNTTLYVEGLTYNDVLLFVQVMKHTVVYKGEEHARQKLDGEAVFLISAVLREGNFFRRPDPVPMPYRPDIGKGETFRG